ncbi:MAG: cyclic nucleotide-binding domain-containing protein [Moorea sp. SIO2B7]|nr:cyclic nucleotide-binding domain-containing protein [Moorena sp. SIO2B7]
MIPVANITITKALIILNELDNDDLNWVTQVGRKKKIAPDEILIYEGEKISALYIILSGSFRVLIKALANKDLARISTGEIVGEISFLDPRPPLATVKAMTNSEVLALPRLQLNAKLQKNMGFASRFYRGISLCLANRIHNTVRRLGYDIDIQEYEVEYEVLNPNLQDNLALAQAKFDWLIANSNY